MGIIKSGFVQWRAALAAGGAVLIGFKNTTVAAKLARIFSPLDAGGAGDGVADDTAAVAATVGDVVKLRKYKVSSFSNPMGVDVTPDGVAVHAVTHRVFNPSQHKFMQVFGAETLQHWFGLFARNSNTVASGDGAVKCMVLSGDSVTYGSGSTVGVPANVLDILAGQRGYKNVSVINHGQPGAAAFQWIDMFLQGDLDANPDLLVIGWGDNDFGLGRTAEQLLADMRTGLTRLRAARTPEQMSIILRTPTTMTDPANNRTGWRIEQIIEGYKQLARDFQCAFVDVYSILQNSHDALGVWMDNSAGGAVHPLDVMQEHICAAVADLALPRHGADWVGNAIYNWSAGTKSRTYAQLPNAYFDGITMVTVAPPGGKNGDPYNGTFYTLKQADSSVLQLNTPLYGATQGYGISARLGFNNAWGPSLGALRDLVPFLVSGWTAAPSALNASFWLSLDGAVNLQGTISAGTLVDGTVLFTLPAGFTPSAACVCIVATSSGFARLAIEPNGSAKIYGAAGVTYIALNSVKFKG
ncbi:SGNH/GDSL hydrolase family protein [Janthinobacterium kumbetense]|uniref:SGNH/GDSL hydrolase family protein n=1 Tax=Janthinobacterium kumbetense TaxID=2950280 RepID=A0ABT0WM69_9BURK|nr:SGNH/GDSL hydrolase family protein [Janthinobacterium kumbetense]MCM2564824.1 SGNH/GDSL hydrolase family protein [Janthinobacterium kumbetense]